MKSPRVNVSTENSTLKLKIFEAPLDRLADLEAAVNAWLKEGRDIDPDWVQFETTESKRALLLVWYNEPRTSRGAGFFEASAGARRGG